MRCAIPNCKHRHIAIVPSANPGYIYNTQIATSSSSTPPYLLNKPEQFKRMFESVQPERRSG